MSKVIAIANQKGCVGKTTEVEGLLFSTSNEGFKHFMNTLDCDKTTGTQYGSLGYGKGYPKQVKQHEVLK